jgi:hypothetical protein
MTHFAFNFFFPPENRVVYELMWENVVQWGRPQMTIWRMRISMPNNQDYKHKLRICTYSFPTKASQCYTRTFRNCASLHIERAHRYHPNTPFYIFFQQIHIINILNMLHNLRSFLFKMSFIS